jgi:hypothetical protein
MFGHTSLTHILRSLPGPHVCSQRSLSDAADARRTAAWQRPGGPGPTAAHVGRCRHWVYICVLFFVFVFVFFPESERPAALDLGLDRGAGPALSGRVRGGR